MNNASAQRLGFGCARLSLAATRRENSAILGAAWDEGIRWFDVARSYSYGGAERILGKFLAGRREDATVVTKFGISPPDGLMASAPAQALAGAVVRRLPRSKSRGVAAADAQAARGQFSVATARDSLHNSLRALGTDYVDGLLLHEAGLADARRDDLRAWLEDCRGQGKILRWGTATTDLDETAAICRNVPEATSIVQIPDSVFGSHLDPVVETSAGTLVSHSLLARDLPRISVWLDGRADRQAEWSARLQVDTTRPSALAGLVLNYALTHPGDRVVLFSSRDAERCRAAARAARSHSDHQVRAFRELLRAIG
jgi:aryl-alcohol dehydrogenase-like predicted oxidoreductase